VRRRSGIRGPRRGLAGLPRGVRGRGRCAAAGAAVGALYEGAHCVAQPREVRAHRLLAAPDLRSQLCSLEAARMPCKTGFASLP